MTEKIKMTLIDERENIEDAMTTIASKDTIFITLCEARETLVKEHKLDVRSCVDEIDEVIEDIQTVVEEALAKLAKAIKRIDEVIMAETPNKKGFERRQVIFDADGFDLKNLDTLEGVNIALETYDFVAEAYDWMNIDERIILTDAI